MRMRIKDSEIPNFSPLFPVRAFFNAPRDSEFIEVVDNLLRGLGCGFDDTACTFPSDLDALDKPFVGVRFWVYGAEEVIVDDDTFLHALRLACQSHISRFPGDEALIAREFETRGKSLGDHSR